MLSRLGKAPHQLHTHRSIKEQGLTGIMPGYAAIRLTTGTLGSVLSSLSDTPGGEARFMHACLVYPYKEGEDVYFVRGNFKNKGGLYGFDDHLFTEAQLKELF